jgi:tetraacyldisaccharide 4'-kinase
MIQSWISKILLSPLALVYGAVVSFRTFLYRTRLLRSSRFDVPIICVGNISTGGTGKTPHIEYLIRLLQPYINVSVLSRGYKRKTEGFRMVQPQDSVLEVGDEPLQFKLKYASIPVAVSERRAYAIPQMLYRHPDIQAILLDDAFQHLAVTPYLHILLTEYDFPFTKDFLLPAGNLRDWRSTNQKADIIVITKCPTHMQLSEKQLFIDNIKPLSHQKIFFSYFEYDKPYRLFDPSVLCDLDAETEVLLVCGIARTEYLVAYLSSIVKSVTTLKFEDHRLFSNYDVAQFKRLYDGLTSRKKVIITTEKDATRLNLHRDYLNENQLDIYVLPVEVNFLFNEKKAFDDTIKQALLDFKI